MGFFGKGTLRNFSFTSQSAYMAKMLSATSVAEIVKIFNESSLFPQTTFPLKAVAGILKSHPEQIKELESLQYNEMVGKILEKADDFNKQEIADLLFWLRVNTNMLIPVANDVLLQKIIEKLESFEFNNEKPVKLLSTMYFDMALIGLNSKTLENTLKGALRVSKACNITYLKVILLAFNENPVFFNHRILEMIEVSAKLSLKLNPTVSETISFCTAFQKCLNKHTEKPNSVKLTPFISYVQSKIHFDDPNDIHSAISHLVELPDFFPKFQQEAVKSLKIAVKSKKIPVYNLINYLENPLFFDANDSEIISLIEHTLSGQYISLKLDFFYVTKLALILSKTEQNKRNANLVDKIKNSFFLNIPHKSWVFRWASAISTLKNESFLHELLISVRKT